MAAIDPETVRTVDRVDTLFAWALSSERRAARFYEEQAVDAERSGFSDVADIFSRLAEEERRHEAWLSRRMADVAPDPIEPVADESSEAALGLAARAIKGEPTVRKALQLAIEAERRGFDFYTAVAANAVEPAVRDLAEALAREAVNHLVVLRAAHIRTIRDPSDDAERDWLATLPRRVDDGAAWAARRAHILDGLGRQCGFVAERLAGAGDAASAPKWRDLATAIMDGNKPAEAAAGADSDDGDGPPAEAARRALLMAEQAVDHLFAVAGAVGDEAVLTEIQAEIARLMPLLRRAGDLTYRARSGGGKS